MADLARLNQRHRFEELIQRPEPAGEDSEAVGVFDEHRLPREEVAELDSEIDVRIHRLLVRQFDVATDGQPAGLMAATVGCFHDPGPAAGDDGEALLRQ